MWSKGAIVVVKHGDEAMADAIEKGLDIRYADSKSDEKVAKDELSAIMRKKEISKKIADAQENYGYNWTPPKWASKLIEGFAFIVYGISTFIDRYLTIKD